MSNEIKLDEILVDKNCPYCGGTGTVTYKDEYGEIRTKYCQCRIEREKQKKWIEKLYRSGIPKKYWKHDLQNILQNQRNKDIVNKLNKYLKNLNSFIRSGKNLFIVGNEGTGKTLLSTYFAVNVLKQNYTVRFYNMYDLSNILLKTLYEGNIFDLNTNYDLVVIDDSFDEDRNDFSKHITIVNITNYIKKRIENERSTILCTTLSENQQITQVLLNTGFKNMIHLIREFEELRIS